MITTLRDSKARLSELVDLVSRGEEVVITVRGKPKARLCPVAPDAAKAREAWGRELRELRAKYTVRKRDSRDILDALREERL
jgi:prevent-host-death family protein